MAFLEMALEKNYIFKKRILISDKIVSYSLSQFYF